MNWNATRLVGISALLASTACGGAPPPSDDATWSPTLQEFALTGLADPASGRMQLVAVPQAALQTIPEDANGNATSATNATIQVYGATVSFPAAGTNAYPAACNAGAPMAMVSNVEVRSGFTEQLRNVYARIDALSGSQTFCSRDSPGSFTNTLGPHVGLYLYQPLNPVTANANTALFRSKQWALNLPTNEPYWFTGTLLAEVIPLPPTGTYPANGAVLHTGGTGNMRTTLTWALDPLGTGTNPEGFVVARPTNNGAQAGLMRCGPVAAPFNAATCTTQVRSGTTWRTGTSYNANLTAGYWYQWTFRAGFNLPGSTTRTAGTLTRTQTFQVVNP